jgi:hypothetical protein
MGFFDEMDDIDSQFSERRISGTDILVRVGSSDELDKSVQKQMNGEPPIPMEGL